MKDDYKITGQTAQTQIELEKDVLDKIQAMAAHTKLTVSELTNTALKRFISGHKDFLPPSMNKKAG
jgi:predicted DNA-binding ribbon-helix-helix protein